MSVTGTMRQRSLLLLFTSLCPISLTSSSASSHPYLKAPPSLHRATLTPSRRANLQGPDPKVLRSLQHQNHLEGHQGWRASQDHGRKSPRSSQIHYFPSTSDDISLSAISQCRNCRYSTFITSRQANADIQTMLEVVDAMDSFGTIRTEPVLVVGGGLVTDVAGYACASYRRSSNFIRVPTTLIGLIDASVSIKGELLLRPMW